MKIGIYDCLTGFVTGKVVGACLNRMFLDYHIIKHTSSIRLLDGHSARISATRNMLSQYANLDHPVLISGETGCGKELAAKTIHQESRRSNGPFIAVNCAVYTDELLSSELFGSCRGAFTDSVNRAGLFEKSSGGVLFLDEIGEMSNQGQTLLLRAIEENSIRRIGSTKNIPIDLRIIAATNRCLQLRIKQNLFRADLYYRLNQLNIQMPPLRKRREDIPIIARACFRDIDNSRVWRISGAAMNRLIRYNWPGNIRELQSVLLRATVTAKNNVIGAKDLVLNP